jgi:hypothetical protein
LKAFSSLQIAVQTVNQKTLDFSRSSCWRKAEEVYGGCEKKIEFLRRDFPRTSEQPFLMPIDAFFLPNQPTRCNPAHLESLRHLQEKYLLSSVHGIK